MQQAFCTCCNPHVATPEADMTGQYIRLVTKPHKNMENNRHHTSRAVLKPRFGYIVGLAGWLLQCGIVWYFCIQTCRCKGVCNEIRCNTDSAVRLKFIFKAEAVLSNYVPNLSKGVHFRHYTFPCPHFVWPFPLHRWLSLMHDPLIFPVCFKIFNIFAQKVDQLWQASTCAPKILQMTIPK